MARTVLRALLAPRHAAHYSDLPCRKTTPQADARVAVTSSSKTLRRICNSAKGSMPTVWPVVALPDVLWRLYKSPIDVSVFATASC
jgi:hypothetical protein